MKKYIGIFLPVCYSIIIVLLIGFQAYLVVLLGPELLGLILRVEYNSRIGIAALTVNILLLFYLFLIVQGVLAYKRTKMKFGAGVWGALFHLSVLIAITISVVAFLHRYHIMQTGRPATIQQTLYYKAGPFLQFGPYQEHNVKSTSRSMTVWWIDPTGKSNEICYGTVPGRLRVCKIAQTNDKKRFEITLQGLDPGTVYYYSIQYLSAETYSFSTGPASDNSLPFSFITFGDSGHTSWRSGHFSFYRDVLKSVKEHYRTVEQRPAFLLHLGDIVRTGHDFWGWKQFLVAESAHNSIPHMFTTGNHEFHRDYGGNTRYLFNRPLYYSFSYGNARFIVIHPFDGLVMNVDGPLVSTGKQQLAFIKQELARHRDKEWLIVALHIPVLSTGDFAINEILVGQYLELFRTYKVDLVLSGHDHNFDSFLVDGDQDWGGTWYLTSGTGGSRLDSYILRRPHNKWKNVVHDRNSSDGLYFRHPLVEKYHVYGELSWGFVEVKVAKCQIEISYFRWLDLQKFLEISEQDNQKWRMRAFSDEERVRFGLDKVVLVKRFVKKRKFK